MQRPILSGPKRIDAIDRYLAARLCQARNAAAMSQERLGELLGVSGQQIQKYETGKNRIATAMLVKAAAALGLPPAWFFEELAFSETEPMAPPAAVTAEQRALIEDFKAIDNPMLRRAVKQTIALMAENCRQARDH